MTYLDHAATTPLRPEAAAALIDALGRVGNASSLHSAGRSARRTVEESRERIAAALGAEPYDVLFTSGGTESLNLALKGIAWARRAADPARRVVAVSAVEHHAVLDAAAWLGREGFDVRVLPVDSDGRLDLDAFDALLTDGSDLAVVAVMWANNETGTVQPIAAIAARAAAAGVPLVSDAVQAVGALSLDLRATPVAALALTGHKLGGPLGVGALVLSRTTSCTPLLHGGGQEREVRSGTYDVPSIAGFAAALDVAVAAREVESGRLKTLRDALITGALRVAPSARTNTPTDALPGIAHLTFPGCDGDALLMLLDANGIQCSTGAACAAGVPEPSHVLLAMGRSDSDARSSLRFSLGHSSTRADVDALLAVLPDAVARANAAGTVAAQRRAG